MARACASYRAPGKESGTLFRFQVSCVVYDLSVRYEVYEQSIYDLKEMLWRRLVISDDGSTGYITHDIDDNGVDAVRSIFTPSLRLGSISPRTSQWLEAILSRANDPGLAMSPKCEFNPSSIS
jgi:hypothetical protein